MVNVSRAINENTLSNFPCLFSRPILDETVPYLQLPIYRQWHQAIVSAQPQGFTADLMEELVRIDGNFDFYFKTGSISGQDITVPKPQDAFFVPNVGWFFITGVSPWATQGAGYTQVTATFRTTNIITNAGGDQSLIPGYGGSPETVPLPVYQNPYPSGEIADRVLRAHSDAFNTVYGTSRSFWSADQDVSRFGAYAILRFVNQDQIMHPLNYNIDPDDPEATDMLQVSESAYDAKVMISFQGGQALNDRDRWETLVFHEVIQDIFSGYNVGICDDFYPENLTDTDQGRRLQKSRTSYTVSVSRTDSFEIQRVNSVVLQDLSVNKKM